MPYIKQEDRRELNLALHKVIVVLKAHKWPVGDLNYVITKILWTFFAYRESYRTINDIIGVLGCVKAEFLRRKATPYEDDKIAVNGDIKLF